MKDHSYTYSDIQKYILGELTDSEVQKFEATMKSNPEFSIEVKKHMQIAEGISHYGAQQFKSRVKEIYQDVRPELIAKADPKSTSGNWWKTLLVMAVFLAGAYILYNFYFKSAPQTSQEIYAQYFEKYDWNPNARSEQSENTSLDLALRSYTSNSYEEGQKVFNSLITQNPNNIPMRLAFANLHMENDRPVAALPHLEHILTLDDVLYQNEAKWYLGLAYIKDGQIEKAKGILTELSVRSNSEYAGKSADVLNLLN